VVVGGVSGFADPLRIDSILSLWLGLYRRASDIFRWKDGSRSPLVSTSGVPQSLAIDLCRISLLVVLRGSPREI